MRRLAVALAMVGLVAGSAQAQNPISLRSDSPLWTYENTRNPELYPQHFINADAFGCQMPFWAGVYRSRQLDSEAWEQFVRIQYYGAMHCALLFGESYDQADVATAFEDHAWLIMLGEQRRADGGVDELLALQIGIQSGSRYILLRRPAGDDSAILEQLDWRCPHSARRRRARIDIWVQDVCIVASQAELRRIARAAAARPPLARWERLADAAETETPPPASAQHP